jgi:hypothetical protein
MAWNYWIYKIFGEAKLFCSHNFEEIEQGVFQQEVAGFQGCNRRFLSFRQKIPEERTDCSDAQLRKAISETSDLRL